MTVRISGETPFTAADIALLSRAGAAPSGGATGATGATGGATGATGATGPTVPPPVVIPPSPPALSPSMMFYGDKDNYGLQVTQARAAVASGVVSMPFSISAFFRQIDHRTFGCIASFGNQSERSRGLMALSTGGAGVGFFQWVGDGWVSFAQGDAPPIGQWCHAVIVVSSPTDHRAFIDGVRMAPAPGTTSGATAPMPLASINGSGLAITFGSYLMLTPAAINDDRHCFNGTLRDAALISGALTDAEIMKLRDSNAIAVLGTARVIGQWSFKAIPVIDEARHGYDLELIDGGSAPGHKLPEIMI